MRKPIWIAAIFLLLAGGCAPSARFIPRDYWLYVGTYTRPPSRSKGIYLCRFDALTGQTLLLGPAAAADDPGFQAVSPDDRFMYSVAGVQRSTEGEIDAFAMNPHTGALTFLNQQRSGGAGPAHVMFNPVSNTVWVSNYGGGTVAVLPVEANGQVDAPAKIDKHAEGSNATARQRDGHPHQCVMDPWGKYVYSPDLGTDGVFVYPEDWLGFGAASFVRQMPPIPVPAGSGPRHLAFSPDGNHAYLINEISSTLIAYQCDYMWPVKIVSMTGKELPPAAIQLRQIQMISMLPADFTGPNTAAEVVVDPSGRFLYASNRGADDIARFTIDPSTGLLTLRGFTSAGGKCPRMIAVDPTGRFLFVANQLSDTLVAYRINPDTGDLIATDTLLHVPTPICLTFVPIQ